MDLLFFNKAQHIRIDCVTPCVGVRREREERDGERKRERETPRASGRRHCVARTKGESWHTETPTEKPGTKLDG